jgi:hypothetical protein
MFPVTLRSEPTNDCPDVEIDEPRPAGLVTDVGPDTRRPSAIQTLSSTKKFPRTLTSELNLEEYPTDSSDPTVIP